MNMANLKLPSYLAQSEAVKARIDDLKRRDVILEVSELGKTFESFFNRLRYAISITIGGEENTRGCADEHTILPRHDACWIGDAIEE